MNKYDNCDEESTRIDYFDLIAFLILGYLPVSRLTPSQIHHITTIKYFRTYTPNYSSMFELALDDIEHDINLWEAVLRRL